VYDYVKAHTGESDLRTAQPCAAANPGPRTLVTIHTSRGRVAELESLSTANCAWDHIVVTRIAAHRRSRPLQNHSL
jgi:hypothetical protein